MTVPRAVRDVQFDVNQNLSVQRGDLGLVVGVQRGALGLVVGVQRGALGLVVGVQRGELGLVVGVQRGALGLVVGVQRGDLGHRFALAEIDHIVQADSYFVLWFVAAHVINALIHVMRLFTQLLMMQKPKPALCRANIVIAAGE